jgi:2-polyprenyl-3-methyl-5-hydroxy-6-metoxy-1,4-benzoquinol methylase
MTALSCNACGGGAFDPLLCKDGYELVRCGDCGLICVANPPSDEQRAQLYSFESGYHVSLDADPVSVAFHAREAAANLRALQRWARSGKLLDIGCSTGLFLSAARAAGWDGQGLEYSPDSSRIAREVHHLEVRTGELRADTYPPGSFDVVTLWDVIEHVPDPFATLVLIRHILAPGGRLFLKTPNADGLYPRLSLRLAHRLGFWGHAEPPGHLYQFSVATLSRLAERAGYAVVEARHQRIPISYSFGSGRDWFRSAKWAAYCALFVPMAWLGPWLKQGDDQVLVLQKAGG